MSIHKYIKKAKVLTYRSRALCSSYRQPNQFLWSLLSDQNIRNILGMYQENSEKIFPKSGVFTRRASALDFIDADARGLVIAMEFFCQFSVTKIIT